MNKINPQPQNVVKNTPLSLYVHWPFCKAKCPYCDFNSHVRDGVDEEAWAKALCAELDFYAAQLPGRQLHSIFFGGGTPSLMAPSTVAAVIDRANQHWPAQENIEITLEANPTSVEAAKLRGFRDAGVNRLSMGVQALDSKALFFLGREHSVTEAMAALEVAQSLFTRSSFDIIYARPEQTLQVWERELEQVLRIAPSHLSLYQLTIEPATPFFYRHDRGQFALPVEEVAAQMYEFTQERLEAAGLPAYEISNHAIPGEECRHNMNYWRAGDWVGVGPGAHGRFCQASGGERLATVALKSPERWLAMVQQQGHGQETLVSQDATAFAEEILLMGLRLCEGVGREAYEKRTGFCFEALLSAVRSEGLVEDGLVQITENSLSVTPSGMLLLNRIIEKIVTRLL